MQNTTTINEPVAQSFGDYRSAGAEVTQHFTQRCAMRGNRARNEDQLPQSSRDCLGDAGKREAGHRMADQGHIGQIFLNDLISYGCDEIGDCERGQIAGPGRSTATARRLRWGRSSSQHDPEKPPPWTSTYVIPERMSFSVPDLKHGIQPAISGSATPSSAKLSR